MSNNSHVLLICSRLDPPGGTEKAVVNTANLLQSNGHKVTVLIIDQAYGIFFPVHPSVTIRHIDLHFGTTPKGNLLTRKLAFLKHVKQLRSLLAEINAGIIIASEYHLSITTWLAAKKLNCRIYSWEHHHFNEQDKSRFWKYLLYKNYPKLDGVICLNSDEAKLFSAIGAKPFVIPNFVERQHQGNPTKTILTVARLSHLKGIDQLLQVAGAVLSKHTDWKWKIIGDGDMKKNVLDVIQKTEDQIILQPPVSNDLSKEYSASAVYVMTSRNECFPMVLLEAMSYGVPCISFDCETGPRHIINHQIDGLLVADQNISAMISAIESLITNEDQRRQLAGNAYDKVLQFSPEKVYELWRALLKD